MMKSLFPLLILFYLLGIGFVYSQDIQLSEKPNSKDTKPAFAYTLGVRYLPVSYKGVKAKDKDVVIVIHNDHNISFYLRGAYTHGDLTLYSSLTPSIVIRRADAVDSNSNLPGNISSTFDVAALVGLKYDISHEISASVDVNYPFAVEGRMQMRFVSDPLSLSGILGIQYKQTKPLLYFLLGSDTQFLINDFIAMGFNFQYQLPIDFASSTQLAIGTNLTYFPSLITNEKWSFKLDINILDQSPSVSLGMAVSDYQVIDSQK